MTSERTDDPIEVPAGHGPVSGAVGVLLERSRYLAVIGVLTSLVLAAASFIWAIVKAVSFVKLLVTSNGSEDVALVKLFESIDVVLIGTVMLIMAVGLWELFIGDLDLPGALTMKSFDDLKAKIATTLLLVLVVRFLETLVQNPEPDELLALGISVTLVGGLLMVFAVWRR